MNKKFVTIIMVTLAVICHCGIINAQTSGNVIIGLLSETPTSTKSNCDGQDLMTLLSNDGKEWIESIECLNVDIVAGQAGAQLTLIQDNTQLSYIQFNFKQSPLLKATNVSFYGFELIGNEFQPRLYINDILTDASGDKYFKRSTNSTLTTSTTASDIELGIQNKAGGVTPPRIYVTNLGDNGLVRSCKIELNANSNIRIPLYAIRVFYSSQETNSQSSVVEDLESDITDVKYFDLQGRELKDAPQKGIYLRQANGKTTKHIAR